MGSNMRHIDVIRLVPKTAFKSKEIELSKDAALLATAVANYTVETLGGLRQFVPLTDIRFESAARELQSKGLLPASEESSHAKG